MSSTVTMSASPRPEWEKRIAELINESRRHTTTYVERIGDFDVSIHPSVYSPKYFPETLWYGRTLVPLVQQRSFLEVGVGSGLVSLHLAAAGSRVTGVDVNEHAVETTRANFAANGLSGTFLVSDIFDAVDGAFDVIFWNHPWQMEARVPLELKSETTFDEDYRLLRRFVAQARNHLNPGGFVLLGTRCYADLAALEAIYAANGYSHELVQQGQRSIGEGVVEEYYVIRLVAL